MHPFHTPLRIVHVIVNFCELMEQVGCSIDPILAYPSPYQSETFCKSISIL